MRLSKVTCSHSELHTSAGIAIAHPSILKTPTKLQSCRDALRPQGIHCFISLALLQCVLPSAVTQRSCMMSVQTKLPKSTNSRFRRVLPFCSILFVAVVSILASLSWQAHNAHREWTQQVESHGARVVNAGYSRSGGMFRIPIIRDIFVRTQIEVFVPDSKTARAIASHLVVDAPPIGRLWIHLERVDGATAKRLMELCPDVPVTRYTAAGD